MKSLMVREIKHLFVGGMGFKVELIRREQNAVSHALAWLGRTSETTAVWLGSGPEVIQQLCLSDCNTHG